MRWKSDREDEFLYLKLLIAAAVVTLIAAGLIEWNVRRQAAAITRELLRPPTKGERRQIRAMEVELERQAQAEVARLRRQRELARRRTATRVDSRPLVSGERCIDGQRIRRLENEWREIGTCLNAPAE